MIKRDRLTVPQRVELLRSAEEVWAATTIQPIDDAQIARAAGLCERYQLRAYDALHLAAAEALMRILSSKHMRWFGFDEGQNKAAVALGLRDGMVQ
jgi:predicted nucleic acid-binding protein